MGLPKASDDGLLSEAEAGVDKEALGLRERAREAVKSDNHLELERIAHRLVALGEATGERSVVAVGYYNLGIALTGLNRGDEAGRATRSAIELFEALGDRFSAARAMMNLALVE